MRSCHRSNIVFKGNNNPIKVECEVCGFVARDDEDLLSIKNNKVCTDCYDLFVNPETNCWKQNVKPTREVAHKRLNILIEEV